MSMSTLCNDMSQWSTTLLDDNSQTTVSRTHGSVGDIRDTNDFSENNIPYINLNSCTIITQNTHSVSHILCHDITAHCNE